MTTPRATYRLQLTEAFPFAAAQELLSYLDDLGVSHVDLSPVLTARPGSRHFSDVADHGTVSAALGGEDGLRALADAAHARCMGLIGEVVAHHMGAGEWAPLWDQLLGHGRSSIAARAFDVDWESPLPGSADKVIVPVLEDSYGDELEAGSFSLEERDGAIRVRYRDRTYPVSAESAQALERLGIDSIAGVPGETRTWQRMHSLLEQQHYRLVSRRAGVRLVNYRRYLDVDDLAALRVEDDNVFDATHQLMLGLVREGVLDGLRVDHVDGLADPAGYLRRLRDAVGDEAWLVVESFVPPGGELPAEWPVDGTTGYELLRTALGAQVDPGGWRELSQLADEHDGLPDEPSRWRMKADVLDGQLGPDLRRVTRVIWAACQDEPAVRDVDYRTLLEAVSRLATAMPRHRCTVDPDTGAGSDADRAAVAQAVAAARVDTGRGDVPERLWTHLEQMLTGRVRWTAEAAEAVTRFQQLTAPVMLLGHEERYFNRHQALIAACEVGCDPDQVARVLEDLHAALAAMPPRGMATTASHDTKLGEDVRMRIAALSGMSGDWSAAARTLLRVTSPPDAALGLRLLQTAIGVWPAADDGEAPLADLMTDELIDRFVAHAIRCARGQAVLTTHGAPDAVAEADIRRWAATVLDPDGPIVGTLRPLALRAGEIGVAASLSQTLTRLTVPGVPSTYQGTERWDDALSPPDNRRDVDFDRRSAAMPELVPASAAALWAARSDGRIKQHVLRAALGLRRDHPERLGPDAPIEPVHATGRWSRHLLAWSRGRDRSIVVVAPRVFGRISDGGRLQPLGRIWADTDVVLPDRPGWRDVLTGHTRSGGVAAAAELFDTLPVALLLAEE